MEPFSLLLLAICATIAVGVTFLTISMIRDYVREKRSVKSAKAASAILKRKLESGEYEVNVGFWEDGEFSDVQQWKAEDVDDTIKGLREGKVIFDREPEPIRH